MTPLMILKMHLLMKNSIVILILLLAAQSPLHAAVEEAVKAGPSSNLLENIFFISCAAVIIGALLALWNLYSAFMESAKKQLLEDLGIAPPKKEKIPTESWWTTQFDKWNALVPIEKEKDIMLDHDYDGIKELDNSLPPWWTAMFYISIIVGVIYFGYYHIMHYGPLSAEEYTLEMEFAKEESKKYLARQANSVDESNVTLLSDPSDIGMGKTIFMTNCAVCHGPEGQGGIGPNLTDNYWIHGGDIKDVFKTVKYGVREKGMEAWQSRLRPIEMHRVSSFIMTLVGTEVSNPKDPQGDFYDASASTEVDSTQTVPNQTIE